MRTREQKLGDEKYIGEQNRVLEELGRKRELVSTEYAELLNKYERALMEIDKMYTYNESMTN